MRPAVIITDRILSFLLALILIALGVFSVLLYFDVQQAQDLADRIDWQRFDDIVDTQWYVPLLVLLTILFALIGLWLITANTRRYRAGRLHTATSEGGPIQVSVRSILKAAGEQLEQAPAVERVDTFAKELGDRTRADITLTLHAGTPPANVAPLLRQLDEDLAESGVKVDTRYRIHQAAVNH